VGYLQAMDVVVVSVFYSTEMVDQVSIKTDVYSVTNKNVNVSQNSF